MKKSRSCASIQTELAAYAAHAYASSHTIPCTSPEGTFDNSPAALAPGTHEPNPPSPGGTAENHASNSRNTPLPESIQHHLAYCPACQRTFAELQRAASIQSQTAPTLPTPQINPNLHPWLAHKISNTKSSAKKSTPRTLPTFHWRPILVTSIALVTFLAILAFFTLPNPPKKTTVAQALPPQPSARETLHSQPTLITLRHQIIDPTEQIIPLENPATSLPHYRVKDAYIGVQN